MSKNPTNIGDHSDYRYRCTNTRIHHHGKSHPQIAGESEASKDGQYRGEETKKTNQRFRTNLVLHSLILCERKKKERAVH